MLLLGVSFAVLLLLGMPVAFVLAVAGSVYMIYVGAPYETMIIQNMISTVDSFVFLCIPFFLLTGDIMCEAGITEKLVNLSRCIVGGIRGSLAHVTVIASMVFAGISGSASADASALGSILIPGMKKEGYTVDFSCALIAQASVIGPIIPPSITMVIMGLVTGMSIGKLFIAGAIPGVLIGLLLMGVIWLGRKNHPPSTPRPPLPEVIKILISATPALVTPLIICVGIITGIFTPTEASVVAVAWSLICGLFIYRGIKLSDLPRIFLRTGITTGAVLVLLAASGILGWALAIEQIPLQMGNFLLSISANQHILLLYIIILVLILGTFMDPSVIVIIFAPVLLPIAVKAGMDPLHFCTVLAIAALMGLCTPPLGVCLFIAASIGKISVERVVRAILPFLFVSVIALFLVAYIPALATWLPNLLIH